MRLRKKYCDYHKHECYIWKNYEGKRFCREGWYAYQKEHPIPVRAENKETNKALIQILDGLLRKYLLLVKPAKCFTCDEPKDVRELQVGHFISRRHMGMRWDLLNVELQCINCNCILLGNLGEYEAKLDPERLEYLNTHRAKVVRLSQRDLEERIQLFRNLIQSI